MTKHEINPHTIFVHQHNAVNTTSAVSTILQIKINYAFSWYKFDRKT